MKRLILTAFLLLVFSAFAQEKGGSFVFKINGGLIDFYNHSGITELNYSMDKNSGTFTNLTFGYAKNNTVFGGDLFIADANIKSSSLEEKAMLYGIGFNVQRFYNINNFFRLGTDASVGLLLQNSNIYLPTVEYKTEDYNTRLGIFCKVGLQGEYKLTNYLSLLLSDGFLFGTLNEKDLPDASLNIYKAKRIQPIYSNYFSIGLKFSF